MDNRLRFLYRVLTEMWGRRRITGAGNGKTGASIKAEAAGKSASQAKDAMRNEIKVVKRVSCVPRKAAIA